MSEIIIEKPVLKGRSLRCRVTSLELGNYIKENELFIDYDADIYADESILSIPLLATVLPLAWLSGADIIVERIDKNFKEAMIKVQDTFKTIYPLIPFNTEIHADEVVDNRLEPQDNEYRTGLLFSGGADSMYSLLTNMNLNPRLLMTWGLDNFPYPEHPEHWNKTIEIYQAFAERKKLDFNLIKTNVTQILDNRRISHRYHRELYDGAVRSALQHSLVLLPLVAPLSTNRFDNVIIAASFTPSYDFSKNPRAAIPQIDESIIWADLSVKHDGFNLSRNEKIFGPISDFLKNDELVLRVCLRSAYVDGKINDSTCEKCLRTIASLTLAGVDPNHCGFKVDESTFRLMRSYWEKARFSHPGFHWTEIKKAIPEEITQDMYGSKDFFEWFRSFDFKSVEKNWSYVDLYNSLPYWTAKNLDRIFMRLGINVHQEPVKRDKTRNM